jgi:predicted transcriptional regulator of viral defense system
VASLDNYADDLLASGRETFSGAVAQAALRQSAEAFQSAVRRAKKKGLLMSPWRNFFVILRPEDRAAGAPDPVRWIDPLMKHLGMDYRVSLLRAAAFHGSSHQASMVFSVLTPRQLRSFEAGRHRIQFLFQQPETFAAVNRAPWLADLKSESGIAKAAGVELTLLDCMRYFHKAGGINGVAQVVRDIGGRADSKSLAKAAEVYENSVVRRLGYLLENFGHERQARALRSIAQRAKSVKPLNPEAKPFLGKSPAAINTDWQLVLNQTVEVDE